MGLSFKNTPTKKQQFTPGGFWYNPYDQEDHETLYYQDESGKNHRVKIKIKDTQNILLLIEKIQKRLHDCSHTENPDKIIFYCIRHNDQKEGSLLISKIDGFWIIYQIGNYPIYIANSINFVLQKINEWEKDLLQKEEELPKTKKDLEVTKELILQDAA